MNKEGTNLNIYSTKEKSNSKSERPSNNNNSNNNDNNINGSLKDKDFYNNLQNINNYLKEYYHSFYDNFELLNFIKSGSVGRVFEGKLKHTQKELKLAFKFDISKDKTKKLFKDSQEITILKKLKHKNISQIYAFITMPDNSIFSVLEYAKYGDLENFEKNLLKRKILSETIICYFCKQILESLEYIHKCKIAHMDIKEGNILIDSNLNIKLTDFSVSCSYSLFHPGEMVKPPFVGTSKYMSPEIINRTNMKIKDFSKIDLYSLGVTLYKLIFGFYPYKLDEVKNKDYDNILKNIKLEILEFPKDRKVSDLFKDFLKGLLEKDYTKRFNIKESLNHSWIKGSEILFDEKENAFSLQYFLTNLITDNILKFNKYINKDWIIVIKLCKLRNRSVNNLINNFVILKIEIKKLKLINLKI